MIRPLLSAAVILSLTSACTSPASLAAGVINATTSTNPYWNWSMAQMVGATDCDQDGHLTLAEINRSWSASDDAQAVQSRPFTAAEYDKAVMALQTVTGTTSPPPDALLQQMFTYARNHRFIGPCR